MNIVFSTEEIIFTALSLAVFIVVGILNGSIWISLFNLWGQKTNFTLILFITHTTYFLSIITFLFLLPQEYGLFLLFLSPFFVFGFGALLNRKIKISLRDSGFHDEEISEIKDGHGVFFPIVGLVVSFWLIRKLKNRERDQQSLVSEKNAASPQQPRTDHEVEQLWASRYPIVIPVRSDAALFMGLVLLFNAPLFVGAGLLAPDRNSYIFAGSVVGLFIILGATAAYLSKKLNNSYFAWRIRNDRATKLTLLGRRSISFEDVDQFRGGLSVQIDYEKFRQPPLLWQLINQGNAIRTDTYLNKFKFAELLQRSLAEFRARQPT